MKIGDYVRTKRGQIHKITDLKGYYENEKLIEDKQSVYIDGKPSGWVYWQFKEFVVKSSSNIIDLIEEGDYVNGKEVFCIAQDKAGINNEVYILSMDDTPMFCKKRDIKTIVTKQQFESIEYKIGE